MREIGFAGLALMLAGSMAWGQAAPQRTVLVELFTSEGCSSCPPADALLTRLSGTQTESGELIVGLSEHVTYWNSLGWADPYSLELWTARQNAYGERFRLDSVYTPQVVVNGEREVLGSDGRAVLKAVQDASKAPVTLTIGDVKIEGDAVKLTYTLAAGVPTGAEVWAVIADDMASSDVLRGENGGRRLTHVSVARSLTRVGPAAEGPATVALPRPAVLKGQQKTGQHVVLFVQEKGAGQVLAVESKGL